MATSSKRSKKDATNFSEGAIVRLKLENFLTYDSVEFQPGPSLNVIIGPNGTGKSTIVCAICMGLAGPTNLLGRARQPAEFIKHGCTRSSIEIELYNTDGENYVIKRDINKENKSAWTVNRRNASQRVVEELVSRLKIQVGNLCQFLPQDKVADFAKMTQQELLEATERAVEPDMHECHCKLKSARDSERSLELTYTRTKARLEQEQARNARLEQDVKNYQERQRHLQKVEMLKKKRPWAEYQATCEQFNREKEKKEEHVIKVKAAQAVNAPLQGELEAAKQQVQELEAQMKTLGNEFRDHVKICNTKKVEIEKKDEEVKDLEEDLKHKQKEEASRRQKLQDLTDQLQGLEDQLTNAEDEDVQPQLERVQQEMSGVNRDMNRINQQGETTRMAYNNIKKEAEGVQAALKQLQDMGNRRLEDLRRCHRDTYNAVMWLRANKDRFKATIYEPIMLIINVRDPSQAKYVESHISFNDMKSFVCEDKDDLALFMEVLRDGQGLKINAMCAPSQPADSFRPNKPVEYYKNYGFHSYIRDLFDCPEPVMRYLCLRYQVHQIPVGDKSTKDRVNKVIAEQPQLSNFYTANHSYVIKKSRYGNRAISSRCTELKRPTFLVKNRNVAREEELKAELQRLQADMKENESEYRALQQKSKALDSSMTKLRNQKKELQQKRDMRRSLIQKINMKKDSVKRIETEAVDIEKEEIKALAKVAKVNDAKCRLLKQLQDSAQMCMRVSEARVRHCLRHVRAIKDVTAMENQLRDQSYNLQNLERELEEQRDRLKQVKQQARRLLDVAFRETGIKSMDELPKNFDNLPGDLQTIDAWIHEEQARADCRFRTDESVVQDFEQRREVIAKLEVETAKHEQTLQKHRRETEEVRTRWHDPLKTLIAKINVNFTQLFSSLQCAGEVDLSVPENQDDYEKYGVRIKVKFRDNEALRELTPFHQSGGERSVATVLYMMALQELSQVPFRCVDEINQGMDPQNERKVFELVVKTACQKNTSQYFLLTPKLLPDLQYAENMTVLCVYNGPYMVNHTDWSLRKFIKRRARLSSST